MSVVQALHWPCASYWCREGASDRSSARSPRVFDIRRYGPPSKRISRWYDGAFRTWMRVGSQAAHRSYVSRRRRHIHDDRDDGDHDFISPTKGRTGDEAAYVCGRTNAEPLFTRRPKRQADATRRLEGMNQAFDEVSRRSRRAMRGAFDTTACARRRLRISKRTGSVDDGALVNGLNERGSPRLLFKGRKRSCPRASV